MTYLTDKQLKRIGFKKLGLNVKVSDKASIYEPEKIELHDNVRIDDFSIVSGNVVIGKYSHVTPMCLVAGGEPGVFIHDFCTLAYGVKVFAQSDDYSGQSMVNSLIPRKYKKEVFKEVVLERHCVLGTNSVVMPGVRLAEGTSSGAMTLFIKSTSPWGVYVGTPASRIKERSRELLELEMKFIGEIENDSF
jgi:acetyltransferase-like isoleucine patch superfamily enzyme